MSDIRWRQVVIGALSWIPKLGFGHGPTGGSDSARYCYSVWLRHLMKAHASGLISRPPNVVIELGPGDSIGTGLAALLSGASRYTGIDAVSYAKLTESHSMLDELVELFGNLSDIPDSDEFPEIRPLLPDYRFPRHFVELDPRTLGDRAVDLHRALDDPETQLIRYLDPDTAEASGIGAPADLLFSQAVLEHIDALEHVYRLMTEWTKPNGLMSHTIDFRAHSTSNDWYGHWSYGDSLWWVLRGNRPYLLNREPWSIHRSLFEDNGLKILLLELEPAAVTPPRHHLARRFEDLNDEDLTTMTAFVVARNP